MPATDARPEAEAMFADVADPVREQLDRYGLTALFGADAFHDTVDDVLAAYQKRPAGTGGRGPGAPPES
jgi:hypothetical protein